MSSDARAAGNDGGGDEGDDYDEDDEDNHHGTYLISFLKCLCCF